jgi:hypothetical protein
MRPFGRVRVSPPGILTLACALLACSAASAAHEAAAAHRRRPLQQQDGQPAPLDAAAAPPPAPLDAAVNLTLGPTGVALTVDEVWGVGARPRRVTPAGPVYRQRKPPSPQHTLCGRVQQLGLPPPDRARTPRPLAQAVSLGVSDRCIAGGARLFGGCSVEIAQAQGAFEMRGDALLE